MKTVFFTICAKNYVAYARTLLASMAHHQPDVDRVLVLSDRLDGALDPAAEDFEIIEAEQLGIESLADMAFRYDITEFSTAIKPAAFQHLFAERGYEAVVYLDPDTYMTSPLDEVQELLERGAEAILTPHICRPVEDGDEPDDRSMLQAGVYNLGFLALARSDETRDFLAWWHRRLLRDCRSDLPEGLFVDQKWAELLPCFVERTIILRHPGYNVAYWNLMHRDIRRDQGVWTSNELPLRFFHFSGVDLRQRNTFSKHQRRYTLANIGPLRGLFDEYRDAVLANGWESVRELPYAYGYFDGGAPIREILRRLYREDFEPLGGAPANLHDELISFGNAAADELDPQAGPPISRLMLKIWKTRPDLQQAFDLRSEEGQHSYFGWYAHSATRELELDEIFVTGLLEEAAARGDERKGEAGEPVHLPAGQTRRAAHAQLAIAALTHAHRLRGLYLNVPIPVRHRFKTWLMRVGYSPRSLRGRASEPAAGTRPLTDGAARPGAQLIGYPRAELGMGEHVRLSARALDTIKFPFSIYDFSAGVMARQKDHRFVHHMSDETPYRASIFHINADQMPVARDVLGDSFFEGKYNIGYWAWELSEFPDAWLPSIEMVNEIWAPSRFIRDAIAKKTERPVVWMPLAVHVEAPPSIDRAYFHLPEDRYIFLFSFDFASFASRKNPEAVLRAFEQAFAKDDERVMLVVKTMAHDWHAEEAALLHDRLAADPRIRLIDSVLSHEEIAGLTNCSDAFVSLHRSEGFGRGMAEAMNVGKAVIGTAYSGNTDFMNEETACLVDYTLVPVKEGQYPHHEGQVWAEPDVEQAAAYMRRLVDEPGYGAALGKRARSLLLSEFSPERVGRRIRARLEELGLG
jgi:glycosyltransferase involved in cell wall biosynthesis